MRRRTEKPAKQEESGMRKTAIALLLVTPTVAFAGDVGFTVGLGPGAKVTISNDDDTDPLKLSDALPNGMRKCQFVLADGGVLKPDATWAFTLAPGCGPLKTLLVKLDGVAHHFKCNQKECRVLDP